jgi:type I restriction enzyme, R subunit
MDREAAQQAFGQFLSGKAQAAHQIELINLIIDHLTEHGVMDPGRLYESPFTDINPRGPEGVFASEQVDNLVALLQEIRERAAA